jgi:hypothetical protein
MPAPRPLFSWRLISFKVLGCDFIHLRHSAALVHWQGQHTVLDYYRLVEQPLHVCCVVEKRGTYERTFGVLRDTAIGCNLTAMPDPCDRGL